MGSIPTAGTNMTIYVDPPLFQKPGGRKFYCHMTADTLAELHEFAQKIGVQRHWFHAGSRFKHYDLAKDIRETAIQHGAVQVSAREMVELAKTVL